MFNNLPLLKSGRLVATGNLIGQPGGGVRRSRRRKILAADNNCHPGRSKSTDAYLFYQHKARLFRVSCLSPAQRIRMRQERVRPGHEPATLRRGGRCRRISDSSRAAGQPIGSAAGLSDAGSRLAGSAAVSLSRGASKKG